MRSPFAFKTGQATSPLASPPSGWDDDDEEEDHPQNGIGGGAGGADADDEDDDYDNDSDRGSGNLRRRSSFGDAEDHMLLHRMTPNSGLHHRRALPRTAAQLGGSRGTTTTTTTTSATGTTTTTTTTSTGGSIHSHIGLYETPTPKRKATVSNNNLPYFASNAGGGVGPKHPTWWIRLAVGATVSLYVLVLIQTTRWSGDTHHTMNQNGEMDPAVPSSSSLRVQQPPMPSSSSAFRWVHDWTGRITNDSPLQNPQQQYPRQQEQEQPEYLLQGRRPMPQGSTATMRQLKEQSRQVTSERASVRKTRTRPIDGGMMMTPEAETVSWYVVDDESSPSADLRHDTLVFPPSPPASSDQLCGLIAQEASRAHPKDYPSTAALSKESRVFITGLLSPLGMQLALKLHIDCGVEVIGGVDLMYPNTVSHRLGLIDERLKFLMTHIPSLQKSVGLSFMGILPKKKGTGQQPQQVQQQEEFDILSNLQPTHVIHLASYNDQNIPPPRQQQQNQDSESSEAVPDGPSSPYAEATWFGRHAAWWGMEQILQGMQELPVMPQFLHVTTKTPSSHHPSSSTKRTIQKMEHVLARTYQRPTLSIYLPHLYGEWDLAGSLVHDTIEHLAVHGPKEPLPVPVSSSSSSTLSLLHLDDAVEALVAALQYQPSSSSTSSTSRSLMDLTSASAPELSTDRLVSFLGVHHWNSKTETTNKKDEDAIVAAIRKETVQTPNSHPALAGWKARISLHDGLIRTMAWHLHRHSPFGSSPSDHHYNHPTKKTTIAVERADDFLKRHGQSTCPANDWQCHKSFHSPFPCLSECNTRHQCLPSIFDGLEALTRNVTEGCQIVLYMQALGYDVKDLKLHSEYMEDEALQHQDKLICNFAIIPRESTLVKTVTSRVPEDQLIKFGMSPQKDKDLREEKLSKLNGRLLYRGWILLWVKDGGTPLTPTDQSLLKLSPSKFFHPDVERAVFMEQNFPVSPTLADVTFLVDELKRHALPKRTLSKDVLVETTFGKQLVKRQKFRLPPEPHRRAVIMFTPLRIPPEERVRRGDKKLKVRDAVKCMRQEFEFEGKETEAEIRQRDFYEKVPSYLNRNDLRSSQEPWYQYSMKHWIRSRWVVHDVQLEESRLLRCDWYQEHLVWGNELDQLSFAHIMAVRELKRRIAHQEPDDHFKTFMELHPQLIDLTDSYEWHPMETDMNLLYREPEQWTSLVPDHVVPGDSEDEPTPPPLDSKDPVPLYVRIISNRVMEGSRRLWTKEWKKRNKGKKNQK